MKVGDYVRTFSGIYKIWYICKKDDKLLLEKNGKLSLYDFSIGYKTSSNIIDLIEVGDYVNGSYIYSVVEENKNTGQPRVLFTEEDGVLGAGDIKSMTFI